MQNNAAKGLLSRFFVLGTISLATVACGRNSSADKGWPAGFEALSSAGKVEYVMKHASPDSVARFICSASLGKENGVSLDLNEATLYAYEHYRDKDFEEFTTAYEECQNSYSLSDKMKLYKMAGALDPQQFGYTLGLEYISSIRDNSKSVEQVNEELAEFKKACGSDADTYRRFVIGFKTALNADHGKDLDEAIYNAFINYEENI